MTIIQRLLKILFTLYFGLNVSFAFANFHECSQKDSHCLEFDISQNSDSVDTSSRDSSNSQEKSSCHHHCLTSTMNVSFMNSQLKDNLININRYPIIRLLVNHYTNKITPLFFQNRLFRPPIL